MDMTRPRDTAEAIELWQSEVEGLREATLARFTVATAICMAAWLFWMASPWGPSPEIGWVVFAVGVTGSLLASRLGTRHRRAASLVLVLTVISVQVVGVWAFSDRLVFGLGLLSVIMGVSLLRPIGGMLVGCASCGSGLLAWEALVPASATSALSVPLLGLYALVWIATCIAQYPLTEALHLSLTGWAHLQSSLAQVRDRRAELARTLHALEEATYRIERMNSELLLARYQADAARENKQRFAQTVSHELRGPLNLILGFSRLMAMSPERYGEILPRSYRADLDAIYASSQHVAGLLDDILDLSQIEAEQMPLVRERIDLNAEVVSQAALTVRPLAERKGLKFVTSLDPDLPHILGDRVRLRQVLLNLLTNAIRFTESGTITAATELKGDGLQVRVSDTGRGIATDELPKLFEEFHQLHPEQNQGTKGSGLGLAISRHLVALHGGKIWAESAEGEGTTFFFELPLQEERVGVISTGQRERTSAPQGSSSVLVISDDPYTLRIIARYLDGYQVIGLPRIDDVLDAVQASHPHAIIASPELSHRLAAAVAETPYDVPVLGCSMPAMTHGTRFIDIQAYLMKPVDEGALQTALGQLGLASDAAILVVDDEPDAVRLLERLITGGLSPYRVLRAFGGEEALGVMHSQRPDAVFMDLVMPGMGADEIMGQMADSPDLAQIPVVIVTGQDAHPAGASLGTEITLTSARPVSAMHGIRRLRALLDVVSPDYLPRVAPRGQRPTAAAQ